MTLSVDLCANWSRIGEAPAATLDAVVRHLAVGEWELTGALDALELASTKTIRDVDTIRVVDGDRVVFGGRVAPIDAGGFGGLTITDGSDGQRFALVGPDMWAALASRIAYPTPSTPPPWADAHDVRTGVASTVATAYLEANLGASALLDRRYPGVVLADGLGGSTGTWSARLQRLDEWIVQVCREGGITCRPTVDFDGGLRVYCGPVRDRSTRIVLTDQGDLTEVTTVVAPASATYVVIGGQGDLTARTFAATGGGTGAARRELFVDQTGIPTAGELAQSAVTTLDLAGARSVVQAVVADVAAQQLSYGRDYEVGDVLATQVDATRYAGVVASVTITVSPERQVIRPVFDEVPTDPLSRLIRTVGDLESVNRNNIA
jgi:hypothetical protein